MGVASQTSWQLEGVKRMNKRYKLESTAWVSEYGDWARNTQLITFDHNDLTKEQWDTLETLSDYDRIEYVMAVLDGDDLTEWEG
jgi:hypothetical protein